MILSSNPFIAILGSGFEGSANLVFCELFDQDIFTAFIDSADLTAETINVQKVSDMRIWISVISQRRFSKIS